MQVRFVLHDTISQQDKIYVFDSLTNDNFIVQSLKICNFRNVGVYFHFKTVDLNSIKNSIILFPQDKIY